MGSPRQKIDAAFELSHVQVIKILFTQQRNFTTAGNIIFSYGYDGVDSPQLCWIACWQCYH